LAMTGKNKRPIRRGSIRDTVQKTTIDLASIGEEQSRRVRRLCASLPGSVEKLSHGEPTFFVAKRVYAMFANNHHHDGHIAVYIPVEPGYQATLLRSAPRKYFYPPYVGVKGWVGVELSEVDDDELGQHLVEAWKLIGGKKRIAGR
jgi:hypothetical protein